MPDYKEMYLTLFRATEQAPESALRIVPLPEHADEAPGDPAPE